MPPLLWFLHASCGPGEKVENNVLRRKIRQTFHSSCSYYSSVTNLCRVGAVSAIKDASVLYYYAVNFSPKIHLWGSVDFESNKNYILMQHLNMLHLEVLHVCNWRPASLLSVNHKIRR